MLPLQRWRMIHVHEDYLENILVQLKRRTLILMLDSLGLGASKDAQQFHDVGANTLGHIAQACVQGQANENRFGALHIPNLNRLGLSHAYQVVHGTFPEGVHITTQPIASFGAAAERSVGKDTPSGHWEMAGVPVLEAWGYFHEKENSFPQALLDTLVEKANLPGYLGNCHASGTSIIAQFGEAHCQSGKPILYTSADSVFQIACHEQSFGLQRLYDLCELARQLLDEYRIGRVIARPFIGDHADCFQRTGNRRDYSVLPPEKTLLDQMVAVGGQVIGIGKIADIYAHQGITQVIKAHGHHQLWEATLKAMENAPDQSIIFTNFVDFDSQFGHRRDVAGYAKALEDFDSQIPKLLAQIQPGDRLVLTADHGCDPTWPGTDHTREYVPVIYYSPVQEGVNLGLRSTFADIGQSIAYYHDLPKLFSGESFI